jgi:hypothetical protein
MQWIFRLFPTGGQLLADKPKMTYSGTITQNELAIARGEIPYRGEESTSRANFFKTMIEDHTRQSKCPTMNQIECVDGSGNAACRVCKAVVVLPVHGLAKSANCESSD